MIDKPYGEMSLKELHAKIRGYTVGDMRRKEIQAEIDLRQSQSTARFTFWGMVAAAISAAAAIVAAVAGLMTLKWH